MSVTVSTLICGDLAVRGRYLSASVSQPTSASGSVINQAQHHPMHYPCGPVITERIAGEM